MRFFFEGWGILGQTVILAAAIYIVVVLMLRISGKRTLAKMNAFDFVVTIALGSTLASTITSTNVSLAQGAVALAMLVGLQVAVAWVSVRWRLFRSITRSTPALILDRGRILSEAMVSERVTEDDLRAALRQRGFVRARDAYAVVLETDGTFSVLGWPVNRDDLFALEGLKRETSGTQARD